MQPTDPFVLAPDVLMVPVGELAPEQRRQFEHAPDDVALTRPGARASSRIVDRDFARLLELYREPKSIAEGVLEYARACGAEPIAALEAAFPLLVGLVKARFLVVPDSDAAQAIEPLWDDGARLARCDVVRCVQILEDTEIYQLRRDDGELRAAKILRPGASRWSRLAFENECRMLEVAAGEFVPRLDEVTESGGVPCILMQWCEGVTARTAADIARREPDSRTVLLGIFDAILAAYQALHERGVVHGDVHPRNILIDARRHVWLVDFGLARELCGEHRPPRGAIAQFHDPGYAAASLAGQRPPVATPASEQYALGALLFRLATGDHYLDFRAEREAMFDQICRARPRRFAATGTQPWPALEAVIGKMLAKSSDERFDTLGDVRTALEAITTEATSPGVPTAEQGRWALLETIHGELIEVNDIGRYVQPPTASVNFGSAGAAYAAWRLACQREDAELLAAADVWLTRAAAAAAGKTTDDNGLKMAFFSDELDPQKVGDVSIYHTAPGIWLVQILLAHAMGDFVTLQSALDAYVGAVDAHETLNLDLTMGIAGALLGAAIIIEDLPGKHPLLQLDDVCRLGDQIAARLVETLEGAAPIGVDATVPFFGIAHAWAGVLYALMRWASVRQQAPHGMVSERLEQLAHMARVCGRGLRWPRRHRNTQIKSGDHMSGWCNGSAGMVFLWAEAYDQFALERHAELAHGAATDAWDDDAGYGSLCCGLAGRGYALLEMHRLTGDPRWRERAQTFARRAALDRHVDGVRHSLYKGVRGVALLQADLDGPEPAAMPLFGRHT